MRNHMMRASVSAVAIASLTGVVGCGTTLETQRPLAMMSPAVNAEAARQLSDDAARQADSPVKLSASDRFGAAVHDQYLQTVREANALAAALAGD